MKVRILPGQPSSPAGGETTPEPSRKAHYSRAFAIRWTFRLAEFTKSEADLPKVSGRHREYSRFRETRAGDWVRSALRGAARSHIPCNLCRLGGEVGNHRPGLLREGARAPVSFLTKSYQSWGGTWLRSPQNHQAHNLKVIGSNPIPATKLKC
jgi:hypothetical protein